MKWDDLAKVLAAVGPVAVAMLGLLAKRTAVRGRREHLKHDIELMLLAPEGSDVRRLLERHVEGSVLRLAEDDEKRREPAGMALGVGLLALSGWASVHAIDGSDWWLLLGFPLGLLGLYGFTREATRSKRDWRGRPVG